jgi:hypothetical protein
MSLDYYKVLGVSPGASNNEIKAAYRKLAVKFHPDRNPDPNVANHFKEITEAYNTLGDEEARGRYDLRFSSAFREVFTTEPEVAHRDPHYHRRPNTSKQKVEKWTVKELMLAGIKYTRYCCWAGLVVTGLLALDYALPYPERTDKVKEVYNVTYRRGVAYTVVKTNGGKRLKTYSNDGTCFKVGDPIVVKSTIIYRLPMSANSSSCTSVTEMGYLFRNMIFFPLALVLCSALGLFKRIGLETNFNFGIVTAILLLIHVYLLLSA